MPSLVAISEATTEINRRAESAPQALSGPNRSDQIGLIKSGHVTLRTMVIPLSENWSFTKNFFTIFVPKTGFFVDTFTLLFFFDLMDNLITGDFCPKNR